MEQVFKITKRRNKFLWELFLLTLSCMVLVHIGVFVAHVVHFDDSGDRVAPSMVDSQTAEGVGIESIIDWGRSMVAVHYPTTINADVNRQLVEYAGGLVRDFNDSIDANGVGGDEFYVSFETYVTGADIIGFKFDIFERHASGKNNRNEAQKLGFNLKTGERVAFETYFDENNNPIAAALEPPKNTENSVVTPGETADKKMVALTFDDGPHNTFTPALLDILSRENVPATFFVLGSRASHYPNIAKRAFDSGHQVGSHTFNHKNLTKISLDDLRYEVGESEVVIEQAIGAKPTITRPPYGAINQTVKDNISTPLILWSVDPEDWKSRNADAVYQHVIDNTQDGSIVLMHDVYGSTVEATARIIPELRNRGFVFLTVEQMMKARGKETLSGQAYRHAYP